MTMTAMHVLSISRHIEIVKIHGLNRERRTDGQESLLLKPLKIDNLVWCGNPPSLFFAFVLVFVVGAAAVIVVVDIFIFAVIGWNEGGVAGLCWFTSHAWLVRQWGCSPGCRFPASSLGGALVMWR